MILSGWKQIANYLGLRVRTAQRWQGQELPVKRPQSGPRDHVLADSMELDSWTRTSALHRGGKTDLLKSLEQTRQLRSEMKQGLKALHLKVAALKKEVAALRARQSKKG